MMDAVSPRKPSSSLEIHGATAKLQLMDLPDHLIEAILERVSLTSPKELTHALVSRAWRDMAMACQLRVAVSAGALLSERELLASVSAFPRLASLRLERSSLIHVSPTFLQSLLRSCPRLCHLRMENITGQQQLSAPPLPGHRSLAVADVTRPQQHPGKGHSEAGPSSPSGNFLSGPHLIGALHCPITSLVLHTREVPDWVGTLSCLRRLRLHGCQSLARGFGSTLTALESLFIDTSARIEIPASLAQLARLKTVSLRLWAMDHMPAGMDHLTNVENLSLFLPCVKSQEDMSGCGMYKLRGLTTLKLRVGPGLDMLPQWFGQFTSLQSFRLKCSSRTDAPTSLLVLPGSFWKLKKLTHLSLQGLCNDAALRGIGGLTSLSFLGLTNCSFRSVEDEVHKLPRLRRLRLRNCTFSLDQHLR